MHILLIPSWYPTPENPAAGVFFRDQALALQEAGHRVGVMVSPVLRSKQGLVHVRHVSDLRADITVEDDAGLLTVRSKGWSWLPSFLPDASRLLSFHLARHTFERYVASAGSPHLLHGHSILDGGYQTMRLGKRAGIPTVVTEHATIFRRNRTRPDQDRIVRKTMRGVDALIAVSQALVCDLQHYCPECRIDVVGNVVDTGFFVPGERIARSGPFKFVSIGSLMPKKGFIDLLDAFACAFRGEDVSLQIVGEGCQREILENRLLALGIAGQVSLPGLMSRAEVRHVLQSSHAFVSSSHVETFGVAVAEALACGLPVVTTCSGGPESFVDAASGLLVPCGDPVALAVAMRTLAQGYDRYNPSTIREGCVTRFSRHAVVAQLEEVYRRVT